MDRIEFTQKLAGISRNPCDQEVVAIIFTDGERHLTFTNTIQEGDTDVSYQDVHTRVSCPPIKVVYSVIADVQRYEDLKRPSA